MAARYRLEGYSDEQGNSASALEKRRNVNVCRFINTVASCTVIAANGFSLVKTIVNQIRNAANHKSCGEFTGTAAKGKSAGGDCDTTAEEKTIAGALEDHLKQFGDPLCENQYLNLTHSGTWNGYLLIGPADGFDSKVYCGTKLNFDHCTSGGKNDLTG
ncbi:hypothetical protein BKA59DRAFT_523973 [Fusarium tricinctum]|uniref:Secreted protein CSS2 C-terminal domain-containing protein n=1 Tax=Fusarium tricinctum TaxID=61284 RepID=A0A8K0WC91_9HYPO|nr:hypothetical protein BKA59DRAFT_523973 [Fusarium tricinctum]